jgi:hypothetical protein
MENSYLNLVGKCYRFNDNNFPELSGFMKILSVDDENFFSVEHIGLENGINECDCTVITIKEDGKSIDCHAYNPYDTLYGGIYTEITTEKYRKVKIDYIQGLKHIKRNWIKHISN